MQTYAREIINIQREYFKRNGLDIQARLYMLDALNSCVKKYEDQIYNALYEDLGKSQTESYITEIMQIYEEIKFAKKWLKAQMRIKAVKTPLSHIGGKSKIYYSPYGIVLIISPWNYPFHLSLIPLIGAIAAGNCVVLKPSEYSKNSSMILESMLKEVFESKFVHVFCGDKSMGEALLQERFDYIFFTGNMNIGRIVMQHAAKHLTPITLELGGKNPCIVQDCRDIQKVARRITWGKFINAGQTCVAPDILFIKEQLYDDLIIHIKKSLQAFYAPNASVDSVDLHKYILDSSDYGRIISKRHFYRIISLLDDVIQKGYNKNITFGGVINHDTMQLSPTLLEFGNLENTIALQDNDMNKLQTHTDKSIKDSNCNNLLSLRIMQEEIFAPILPIFAYRDIESCLEFIKLFDSPLALYLFSDDKKLQDYISRSVTFGGGCINDCVLHVANNSLPFGGVGNSGMGVYHGKFSMETFSRKKGIYISPISFDMPFRYPPFNKKIFGLDRLKILKWLFE